MKKLAILGPGLLGGSLALALRQRQPECTLALWARRQEAVAEIEERGIVDQSSTQLRPIVEGADAIVLCVPVEVMPALAEQIRPWIGGETLVTDVGSVKGPVVEALVPIFESKGRFVGSHPMAGSEQSGLSAARTDLFAGATCIVTPHEGCSPETVAAVTALWENVGCRMKTLGPKEHDETIGLISHLPHLLAAALVDFVAEENANAVKYCGNGFRDTTRIASGPVPMWTGIMTSNRTALAGQLDRFARKMRTLADDFSLGNDALLESLLANAKEHRDRL